MPKISEKYRVTVGLNESKKKRQNNILCVSIEINVASKWPSIKRKNTEQQQN